MIRESLQSLGHYSHFALRALLAAPFALRRPRDFFAQLHEVLIGALPLGIVAGLAAGAVVWMHLRGTVKDIAGPESVQILPQALALAVVLEFAPIIAGLIVAGRSGASLGAELGSMQLTEQIDALEVLGLSPLRQLVAPRVLACVIALPLLTVFIAYLAILSGYLAESAGGGSMSWMLYINSCRRALSLSTVIPPILKTAVFGFLIGVTGCYCGMSAEGGTEGVGRAAKRAVVISIFLVLVSDVLLVRLIQIVLAAIGE
ncbi:MAG TPA: ABC transporter permease [Gemmataceae bacterium]|nr:ABC transporter permease [Gemmataceae bacterium]